MQREGASNINPYFLVLHRKCLSKKGPSHRCERTCDLFVSENKYENNTLFFIKPEKCVLF